MGSRDQSKYAVTGSAVKINVGYQPVSPRGHPVDPPHFLLQQMGGGHQNNLRGQRERSFVKPQSRPREGYSATPSGDMRYSSQDKTGYSATPSKDMRYSSNEKTGYSATPSRDMRYSTNDKIGEGPVYWKPGPSSPSYFPAGRGGVRVKPGREIYQPPLTGGSWNSEAPPFASIPPPSLTNSRSVDLTNLQNDNIQMGDRTGLTITLRGNQKGQPRTPLMRRSNTVAITGVNQQDFQVDISGLGRFSPEIEATINKALDDPNRLSGRSLMELVKVIFNRMVESQKMSEPAARLCISIIERETKETFLESLLNTCQEWFHERETILFSQTGESNGRWVCFMSFLNEMYGMLKRKQLHLLTKYEGVPPKLVLLSLLGECCTVSLTQSSLNSVNEVECLFFILTHIGRDMELETPGQMSLLLASLRDAFLHLPVVSGQVRKTLLQLIELQAAGWQLPAKSVMYYYPGANLAT